MFDVLGPNTNPAVATIPEPNVRSGLDLPCKNVDLQTGARWACSRGPWTKDASGYLPLAFVPDVWVTAGLQRVNLPAATPGPGLGKTGGWFFSMPDAPQPPPNYNSRLMMKAQDSPFGAVINLNPCCFGEVYWVGGYVGPTYMAFALWLPYAQWVTGELPIVIHFRPDYVDKVYAEAQGLAAEQRIPPVMAQARGQQPFLDGAWYYLLGSMAFVPRCWLHASSLSCCFPFPLYLGKETPPSLPALSFLKPSSSNFRVS